MQKIISTLFFLVLSLTGLMTNAQITKTIGSGGDYNTLKEAFDAINVGSITGPIILQITGSTTETLTAELNASGTGSAIYNSVTIYPTAPGYTISGNLALPIINLNDADNVTIDGRVNQSGSLKSLTISNTNTGGAVIQFINDASDNSIRYCAIQGVTSSATSGLVVFGTGIATGNENNTLEYCDIRDGATTPTNAIYSAGTSVSADNSNVTISNCNIFNYFSAALASNGIFIASNSSAWTISSNRFYQTTNRTATSGTTRRDIQILTASGVNYTVNNNIIGFANESGTGTTIYASGFASLYRAIELTVGTSSASSVQGNTISGISVSTASGLTTAPGIFTGINALAGNINIGTSTGNTIGATTGTGSISVTSTISLGYIAGIYTTSTGTVSIQNNNIGSISTGGGPTIGYTCYGINTAGTGGNFTLSANTIGSTSTANSISVGTDGTTSTPVCTFYGINNAATGVISISNNIVQKTSVYGTGASVFYGIYNSGGTATLNITGNNVISGTNTGTGVFVGITNSAVVSTLNMNTNVIRSHSKNAASGTFTAISNSAAVLNAININYNQLGNASGDLITYNVANSSAFVGISNSAGAASCELSIQYNDIRGINQSVTAGTNAHTYYINSAATLKQDINYNTFTALTANTTGSVIFISNSVVMPTNAIQNINNNSIITSFTRPATSGSGTLTLFTSTTPTNNNNVTINNNNNNFSNITINGAATITGWINQDAGLGTYSKTIDGNTFNNWTGGTGAITVLNVNIVSADNAVKNNIISNISSAGTLVGITTGAGNDNIFSNTISYLNSTGGTTSTIVSGINITAATIKNIHNNTISNITGNTLTSGSVRGILISGGTVVNAYQNTISGISANANTIGTVSGIWITGGSTVNIDRNKLYNIFSTSTVMSGTGTVQGIQVSGSTANLNVILSNNSIGDIRTPSMSSTNALRGISLISTGVNSMNCMYYNTIYLNGTSIGTNFGSTGIYHVASTTSTTATLDMRNNIIVNLSVPKGTGLTVAYRRSSGTSNTLNNYAPTSNSNLFYSGAPGATRLIYSDGTSSAQTLALYKAGVFTAGTVAPKDQASVFENPPFLSIDGAFADFLHIQTGINTQVESGAVNIPAYTLDYDGDIRQGNTGYSGASTTAPDIGADEGNFALIDGTAPSITYSLISNNSCLSIQTLSAIITDASGVNTSSGSVPRVYYKRSTDLNAFNNNTPSTAGWKYTEAVNTGSAFVFTLDYNLLSGSTGVVPGQTLQYFIVAQDLVSTPNVGINAGVFTTAPIGVALTAAAFPIGGTINSFTLLAGLSGTVTIGASGSYTSLTGAGGLFSDINAKGLAGDLIVKITDPVITESGIVALNAITYGCLNTYSLTIRPEDGVAATLTGTVAGPLVNLNGADDIIFNGLNAGGSSLTIRNTSTAAASSAIQFIADATNNTITNCTIEGSAIGTTSGIILFSTGISSGNDGNTISLNTIKSSGANLATNAIYSAGTSVVNDNSGISIINNNIQDFFNAASNSSGILIASNSASWTINANRFFQTNTRTATAVATYRAININTAAGAGYTITNNNIGFANAGGTGTTSYGGAFAILYRAIELTVGNSQVSTVQGNTVSGINFTTTSGSTGAPGIFTGISILGGSVNITGNTIGAATGNGSISITSATSLGYIAGIYASTNATVLVQSNTISSIITGGTATISYTLYGIHTAGGGQFTISANTIGSSSTANSIAVGTSGVTTSPVCTFNGISNAATGSISIINNTISNVSVYGTGASLFNGIINSGVTGMIDITGNNIISILNTGTGTLTGISNSAAVSTLNINNNIIRNLNKNVATGAVTAISNSGGVFTAININGNQLGNAVGGLITYSVANSSTLTGISNTAGAATSALTIQNNDFRGIAQASAGTNAHTYIINSAATLSQNINGNTFTNLSVNTNGTIIFISNSVIMQANGIQNINNNSIITSFTRLAGSGAVTLFTSTAATNNTNVTVNNNNNNFSNIILSGTATITGWTNTDAGPGSVTKTIDGNTFNNWTAGTGTITVLNVNIISANNATKNNTISNISSAGTIIGISTATGNNKFFSNTLNSLISTGLTATTVTGISITGGASTNVYDNTIYNLQANNITTGNVSGISVSGGLSNLVYRNKIYNISSGNSSITTGTINGILISGATADQVTTLHNNKIGDLRATAANTGNSIIGININNTGLRSATNVYYNSVYLNAVSSGTNFGSSGIYHRANSTATTATLNLRNNIIVNLAEPKGTGLTVVYRLNSGTFSMLKNYAISSNNNLFYAGTPGPTHLIYTDGTNSALTLNDYKSAVYTAGIISPRDQASITENPVFVSTLGSSADFLAINTSTVTFIESGAVNIANITSDFEQNIRSGNPGYPPQLNGSGTSPDIGSDEFDGKKPIVVVSNSNIVSNGNYINLSDAFAAINSNVQTGYDILVTIIDNVTETTTATLNSGTWTTLKVFPSSAGLTISGNIDGAPLINMDGADNVILDGRVNQSGSIKSFTIINNSISAAAGTSTIRFINSAENNTLKYCYIQGASISTTAGIIAFSSSTSGNGNDNNVIEYCYVTNAAGNRPVNALFSLGTLNRENNGNIIRDNSCFDFLNPGASSNGINLQAYTTGWTISGNSFYETTSFIPSTGIFTYGAIRIDNNSGNSFTISDNYIGGKLSNCGGGAWDVNAATNHSFRGIYLNIGTTSASSIQNNTIRNWNYQTAGATPWRAVEINAGSADIGTVAGNNIGAVTGTGSIIITSANNAISNAIYIASDGIINISNNNVGSVTTIGTETLISHSFICIYKQLNIGGTIIINSNSIGSTSTAGSIQAGSGASVSATAQHLIAVLTESVGNITISDNTIANLVNAYSGSLDSRTRAIQTTDGVCIITNNTIYNLADASLSTSFGSLVGIELDGTTASNTVSENTIYNLSNTGSGFSGYIAGIYFSGNNIGNVVSENFIHSLSLNPGSNAASIYGIKIASGTSTYSNNIISLGGNTATTIYGIYETGTVSYNNNIYFNTVSIGGSPGSGITNKSYAFYSAVTTNNRDIRNNIFANFRSTAGGAGLHYAAWFNYGVSTGLTLDYNSYFANGSGGVLGYYNGADKTSLPIVPAQDVNSLVVNPQLINPAGTIATDYKMSAPLNGVTGTGILLDYGTVARGNPPNIGAWEFFTNRWKGTVSTDFGTAANWTSSAVPVSNAPVVFDSDPLRDCYMNSNRSVGNITNNQSAYKFVVNGYQLTIKGNLYFENGAQIDAGATSSTVVFSGTAGQTIPEGAFAGNQIYNLTASNSFGIAFLGDLAVNQTLNLQKANPSATIGCLDMGNKTLTLGDSSTTIGNGDVTGIVKRTTIVANKTYTFGNKYASIFFPATGTIPSTMSVKIYIGVAPAWKPGAIKRMYDIIQTGANPMVPTAAVITSTYLDSELNGNVEENLVDFSGRFPGPTIYEHGRDDHDTLENWVTLTNVNMGFFSSVFGNVLITLDESELDTLTWNGSVSTSWTTVNNWTPTGAPSDRVHIIIPDATLTNYDPSFPSQTTFKSLTIKSGGILNSTAGAQATIIGGGIAMSSSGTFNPNTSNVTFSNPEATFSGSASFYNITIDNGATLLMDSLSTIKIAGAVTNNGIWRTVLLGPTTVEYNGANQTIDIPDHTTNRYSTLILSGSGTKTLPASILTVFGDLILSGTASVSAMNDIVIVGSLSIDPLATFVMGAFNHTIGGDFTHNGTFNATGSNISFTGFTEQFISGTAAETNFNNLAILSVAGVTVNKNITVNGILDLQGDNPTEFRGSLDMGTYTLLMGPSATNTGAGDVSGIVKRTQLNAGISYTFGNSLTTFVFDTLGTLPSEVSAKISLGNAPSWNTSSVKRIYEFIQTGGINCYADMVISYLNTEVNGNDKNELTFWVATGFPGPMGMELSSSEYDTANNWVMLKNMPINQWPTGFGFMQLALAESGYPTLIWNGLINTNWSDAGNWTPNNTPSKFNTVVIPNTTTTPNDPLLPSVTNINNMIIEAGGILNTSSGSQVNIYAHEDVGQTGIAWSNLGGTFNAGNSNVVFYFAGQNIEGSTNFNNLTIDGGASLIPQAGSIIRIAGTLNNNGILDATIFSNTIEYNGTDQTVIIPNGTSPGYSSLFLSGSGIKTMPSSTLNLFGNFVISGTATTQAASVLNMGGNLNVENGSTFITGNYNHTLAGSITNNGTLSASPGNTITMNGIAAQSITGSVTANFENLTIDNAFGVSLFTNINVNSVLSLNNYKLIVGSATMGINGSISKTAGNIEVSSLSSLSFGGTTAITIPVDLFSASPSINNLTINRTDGVTLGNQNMMIYGLLNLMTGVLRLGTNNLTIAGSSPVRTSGFIDASDPGSTIAFTNTTAIILPASIFTGNVNNLTVNGTGGITASSDFAINGVLNLQSANPSATKGSLDMWNGSEATTITMGEAATNIGAGDVTGIVRRTTFSAYTQVSFGNPFTTVSFSPGGTYPSEVQVKISIGTAPSWKPLAIKRIYEIRQTGANNCFAVFGTHYLDSELNGNVESDLVHWVNIIPGGIFEFGRSNYNLTENWVKIVNVDFGQLPPSFGILENSLAVSELAAYTWNGSVSSSWTLPNNWTPQGALSSNSNVIIPDATTTANDPVIPAVTEIKTLLIKTGAILNSEPGAQINIYGSSGAWENNGGTFNYGTCNVIFRSPGATVAGITNFYDVTISSMADLRVTNGNIMRIAGSMTNIGFWHAVIGEPTTVEYNGGNQVIVIPNPVTHRYSNLILSGSGTKTMPVTPLDVNGDFSIAGTTTTTVTAALNIQGNLSIGNGTELSVSPATQMIVSGTLINNEGASGFILKSDSTGTAELIHNTAYVPATVQRYISGAAEAWHFLSSPVSDQAISGSWLPSGTYANGTGYDLYLWNEPNNCWIYKLNNTSAVNWNTVHTGSDFEVGRGYLYSLQATNPTKYFVGNLNNGPLEFGLTTSSSDINLNGFNLVGNPYPSSMDWQASSGWSRSDLVSSGDGYDMWIWNPSANNYGLFNSASGIGTNSVTRYIAPMQGYFVRAAASGNLGFDNEVRLHDGIGSWYKNTEADHDVVSVIVQSETDHSFDEAQIQFGYTTETGSTKLFSNVITAPGLFLPSGDEYFSVRYLTDTIDNPTIPVMFKPGKDGSYTLKCNFEVDKFQFAVLEDRKMHYSQNLKTGSTYSFISSKSDDASRFILHFGPDIKGGNYELPARIFSDGSNLIVDLTLVNNETTILVCDVLGRVLLKKELAGETQHTLSIQSPPQILIVQLKNQQGTISRKVFYRNNY